MERKANRRVSDNKMAPKLVAIIGAGCGGLVAIKTCKEDGLDPVCFDSSDDIGGLWRFNSDTENGGRGSVSNSTFTNTSKETMAFSDFPPPKEFPNYMHHTTVLKYYSSYADRFDVRRHIWFNTHVDFIRPNTQQCQNQNKCQTPSNYIVENGSSQTHRNGSVTKENDSQTFSNQGYHKTDNMTNGNTQHSDFNHIETSEIAGTDKEFPNGCSDNQKFWVVQIQNKVTGKISILYFDYIMICTGHHGFINMPYIEGQSNFTGKIIHTRDIREPEKLKGSRHVVVGVGNSGCDMAVELSRKSKVFLSTRRGLWVLHRLQANGFPADIAYSNRLVYAIALRLPIRILNAIAARNLNKRIDHDLYGLRPRHGPLSAHTTVNDELPIRIICGQVAMKTNVLRLEGKKVYFDDGTVEEDIDNVIMATGYHIKHPFLDESILSTDANNNNQLYLYMFPTSLPTSSLAIIGCVQPGGALAPISEMQCRLAVKVFKGEVTLPNKDTMVKDIEVRRRLMRKRFVDSPRHTVQVNFVPYMDELASLIGCKPKLGRMLFQDPRLAMKCIIEPCTSYQYRLQGPGSWDKARDTIITQMDRVVYPLSTRKSEKGTYNNLTSIFIFGLVLLFASYVIHYFILFSEQ